MTNRSKHRLTGFTLQFVASEGGVVIDRADTLVSVNVPRGELREFTSSYLPLQTATTERLFPTTAPRRGVVWDVKLNTEVIGTRGK